MTNELTLIIDSWFYIFIIVPTIVILIVIFLSRHHSSLGQKSRTQQLLFERRLKKYNLILIIILFILSLPTSLFFGAFWFTIIPFLLFLVMWLIDAILLYYFDISIFWIFRKRRLNQAFTRNNQVQIMSKESERLMDLINSIDGTWVKHIEFIPNWWQAFHIGTYNIIRLAMYITKDKNVFAPWELQNTYNYIYNYLDTTNIELFEKAAKHLEEFVQSGWSIQIKYKEIHN